MKILMIAILGLSITVAGYSQNPVNWYYTAKKIADKTYEVHIKANVQSPWHIYSQTTPDGGPLPTSIKFNKNPLVLPQGKAKEVGRLLQKHEEVFGVDVKYFDGNVDFVQVVKLKSTPALKGTPASGGQIRTNISGTIEFMACTDEQCLPPKTVSFSVKLE